MRRRAQDVCRRERGVVVPKFLAVQTASILTDGIPHAYHVSIVLQTFQRWIRSSDISF
ncbi:hypothetical protein [uncultured Marivita sp.]|jgi:hypothetical protein|uniref:hypothetical protein n=1 Tax=Marivita sp. TaxID=2003365 RepID=UPI0025F07340|nr:hypothetical protein [uncultured Marivita sp.]